MGSAIIVPTVAKGFASVQRGLGIDSYDLQELYGPDTAVWRSKVLDLGPVKYGPPNKSYWFDRSRYCNHGAITGAVWKQEPSGLWVLDFDGSDDLVTVTSAANLSSQSALTIMAWFKSDSLAGYETIVGKGTTDTDEEYLLAVKSNGFSFDVGATIGPSLTVTNITVTANVWHFVVATHSRVAGSSTLKVYLDLVDIGGSTTGPTETPNTLNGIDLTIGSRFTTANLPFNGRIGLFSLATSVLTSGQWTPFYYNTRHLFGV